MKNLKITILGIAFVFLGFIQINAQIKGDWLRPPAQLNAPELVDQPNVNLSWWIPGTPTWLYYGDGSVRDYVTYKTGYYEIATKYESSDLVAYHGMSIKTFEFIGSAEAHPYTLKIWSGEAGDILEYEQLIDTVNTDTWTSVGFATPFVIDSAKTYFIGLSYNITADGQAGTVIDNGPAVEGGKGNLIRNSEGVFVSLTDYGIDNNWSIFIYLELDELAKSKSVIALNQKNKVCDTGVLSVVDLKDVEKLETKNRDAKSPTSFNIYRNNEVVGTSTESSYSDVLLNGGYYTYAVSAVYAEGESAKSNSIEVIYDNNRIPYNTVVTETFINVGETDGNMHSPSSPGPFMGIIELEYKVDNIAPIVYHSGTAILGSDPFSTIDSEERFMYYFMATLSFPMTLFNANLFQGGGSGESMYEVYRPLYDSALTMLTPIAFECELEKLSNSKYMLNATAKKVGIYNDPNTVLHVVLTRETIDYTWNLGNLDEVKFVATKMFPDFEGTNLNFVGDSVANISVEVDIDLFLPASNYRVIAFVQSVNSYTILNGDILTLPKKKNVAFTVVDGDDLPIENAIVSIESDNYITDAEGNVNIGIWDNIGEVNYSVSKDNYFNASGMFNIDTTETVLVQLLPTDINTQPQIQTRIYPNPTNNVVNIVANINANVQVFNSLGVMVYEHKQQQYTQTIDLTNFDSGVYIINVILDKSSKVFRLVKTN